MVTINKKALLDAMPLLKNDIGFQTVLLMQICDQLPTNYLTVVISKIYYTTVWDKPYYILRKGNDIEMYFGTEEQIIAYFMSYDTYPKTISELIVKRFISGHSKIEDYTLEKRGEA